MIDCLILGDSIAVGVHQFRKECAAIAQTGITSEKFNQRYSGEFFSGAVIISLGSNDHGGIRTADELTALRKRIVAKQRVYWILPANKATVADIVRTIATKWGDTVIAIPETRTDGVHPTPSAYKQLGEAVK